MPRISLRKIDALLNGELDPAETARFRAEIEASPEARAYLERQAGLRSDLGWEKVRRALERGQGRRWPSAREPVQRFFRRLNPRGAGLGYLGMAGGAAALTLAAALWMAHRQGGGRAENRLAAKGSQVAEVRLRVRGDDFPPGSSIPVRIGDTLGFSYRGMEQQNVQIWYREDDGEILPFPGREPGGIAWPAATAWTSAPQGMRVEGDWRHRNIWVLLSRDPLGSSRGRKAILAGGNGNEVRVLAFRLILGG